MLVGISVLRDGGDCSRSVEARDESDTKLMRMGLDAVGSAPVAGLLSGAVCAPAFGFLVKSESGCLTGGQPSEESELIRMQEGVGLVGTSALDLGLPLRAPSPLLEVSGLALGALRALFRE